MAEFEEDEEIETSQEEQESEELTEKEAEFLADKETPTNKEQTAGKLRSPSAQSDPGGVVLPSGKALRISEVIAQTASRKHKVILLAGAPKSGKTSLISDIFVSFQKGEFDNILFAGSQTLVGFEEKCWTARTVAMPQVPQTTRTSRQDPTYLQLTVVTIRNNKRDDLLICDISGEVFEEAADTTEACEAITDIAWVDHFVLVLDGEKLASVTRREFVASQGKQLLLRLLDTGVLSKDSLIEIVFTKRDKLDLNDEEIRRFVTRLEAEFRVKLKARGVTPEIFYTSAHYIYGEKDKPFDLAKLMNHWLSRSKTLPVVLSPSAPIEIQREIDRFELRGGRTA